MTAAVGAPIDVGFDGSDLALGEAATHEERGDVGVDA
jgi:hypothetical protein